MFEILLCYSFWFGSYEQLRNNSHASWWSSVCVILSLQRIVRTKTLFKFQIILKLPSVESSACLSELSGTEFEGSVTPINESAWSAMCESRWRILLFWLQWFYSSSKTPKYGEPRINCNTSIFGTVRTHILCRITHWTPKTTDIVPKKIWPTV